MSTGAVAPLLQMRAISVSGRAGLHQRQPVGSSAGNVSDFG